MHSLGRLGASQGVFELGEPGSWWAWHVLRHYDGLFHYLTVTPLGMVSRVGWIMSKNPVGCLEISPVGVVV